MLLERTRPVLLLDDPLCVGSFITCTHPRAAVFEDSIEWGEEDSPADTALLLQSAAGSFNKVSSEDHGGAGRCSGSQPTCTMELL